MKFSMKMAVLSMAGVLALGGVATAASFIFGETSKSETVSTDSAIIVKWDESTLTSFTNVGGLTNSMSQYRELTIDWSASKLVTGTIALTLTLSDENKNIIVDVSDESWSNEGVTADYTLSTSDGGTSEAQIEVASLSDESANVSKKTYYLKISTSAAEDGTDISGKLTAKLDHITTTSSGEGA